MQTVRVLLSRMPKILLEIFEYEIMHQPDLELVHEEPLVSDIPLSRLASPDVVIVGNASTDDLRIPLSLLTRWPRARVMLVTPAEGEAASFDLRLHTTDLGRVSPAELVRSIRMPLR